MLDGLVDWQRFVGDRNEMFRKGRIGGGGGWGKREGELRGDVLRPRGPPMAEKRSKMDGSGRVNPFPRWSSAGQVLCLALGPPSSSSIFPGISPNSKSRTTFIHHQ